MSLLRTGVSALEFSDPDAGDNGHDANVRQAVRLLARIPTVIMAVHRLTQGLEPIAPRADLGHAANLLYMLRGEEAAPYEVEALNVSLILYAEHGYNASTFTARVTASTLSGSHRLVVSLRTPSTCCSAALPPMVAR